MMDFPLTLPHLLRRAETFDDLVALDGHLRPSRPRSLQPA